MHDDHIEGQLRAALRDAGGSLSVTITTAELERRLAARRRAANGRRLSFLAAGVAAIAIGSMVAASNGWLSLPAVGVVGATPSPSPSTSASLAALPVASPTNEPIASRQPLGRPDQAILVRATGDPLHPDGFEVTRFDPITAKSEVVATIPWSVLPGGIRVEDVGRPMISATGWLAIPFNQLGSVDGRLPLFLIVDVTDPTTKPWILDGSGLSAWNANEQLGEITGSGIYVYDPSTQGQSYVQFEDASVGTRVGRHASLDWSTAPGTLLLARRGNPANPDWGSVGADGAFTQAIDLPPAYQRTGLERPTGAAAHTVESTCDGVGTAVPTGGVVTRDCNLVERDASGTTVATRLDAHDAGVLIDEAWAADGSGLWMLFYGDVVDGKQAVRLDYARADDGRNDIAGFDLLEPHYLATILGSTSETEPGSAIVAIGNGTNRVLAFIGPGGSVTRLDGTSWFAGWAGSQPDYDPD